MTPTLKLVMFHHFLAVLKAIKFSFILVIKRNNLPNPLIAEIIAF